MAGPARGDHVCDAGGDCVAPGAAALRCVAGAHPEAATVLAASHARKNPRESPAGFTTLCGAVEGTGAARVRATRFTDAVGVCDGRRRTELGAGGPGIH